MKILALDCSTSEGNLVLSEGGKLLVEKFWSNQRSHGEVVVDEIRLSLESVGWTVSMLEGLAVGIGPGRFTGLRVAINAIRSIAYSFDLPVVAINSLRILAENAPEAATDVVCMINAFKNQVFLAKYHRESGAWKELMAPKAVDAVQVDPQQGLKPLTALGDGFSAYEKVFPEPVLHYLRRPLEVDDTPRASRLAVLALQNFSRGFKSRWTEVRPLYIRASEAEERLAAGLLKPVE